MTRKCPVPLVLLGLCLAWPQVASADNGSTAQPVSTLLLLGALALIPVAFMSLTSFVKISVVFSILRNALGTGQVPSGTVVAALAAILTLYVMAPVGTEIAQVAGPAFAKVAIADPLAGDSGTALIDALRAGAEPVRKFLERNSGARERKLFLDLARRVRPAATRGEITPGQLLIVVPSFLVTELTEAFQIGFLIFIPFLVIDMVIANVLLALGMHMLAPTTISLPFKLLLFVLVDGWYLLARALVLGYQ